MNFKLISALAIGALAATPTFAATLDFEGATGFGAVQDFYNGGTDSNGASGTNYGISFDEFAQAYTLASVDPGTFSNAPTPETVMAAAGGNAALNVAAGFSGTTSFYYSAIEDTTVDVWSGLHGTGTVLATFVLTANDAACGGGWCQWDKISVDFAGIAKSIQFGSTVGTAGFDNVEVAPVPLPAAAWLLLSACGGLGAMIRRKSAV